MEESPSSETAAEETNEENVPMEEDAPTEETSSEELPVEPAS